MHESDRGRLKMFCYLTILVFTASLCWSPADSRVIQKRAAFYIANETMCIVDGDVYRNGDPVPTDDECERCTCRPPGFSCVLRDCDTKPGCKAVRKAGECCPEYVCGCVHNNRLYEDGELIKDLQNNCYTCRCHGSSISCTFADCRFRGDCPPEYVPGECCPRYDHCPVISTTTTTTTMPSTSVNIVQQEIEFLNITTQHLEKFTTEGITVTVEDITTTPTYDTISVKFTLSGEKISSIQDFDTTLLTTLLPLETVTYKESTKHIITPPGVELTTLKEGLLVDGFDETTTESFSHITSATTFDSSASTVPPADLIGVQTTTTELPDSSEKSDSLTTQESEIVSASETTESGGAKTTHKASTYDHDDTHLSTSDTYDVNDTLHSDVTTDDTEETTHEVSTYDHDDTHLSTSEKYDINDTLHSAATTEGTTHEVSSYDHDDTHLSTSDKYDINDTLHSAVTTGGTEGTTHEVPTYDHGYIHFSTSEKYDINDTLHSAVTTGGTEGTTHEVPTYDHGYIHFSTSEKYDINDTLHSAVTTGGTEGTTHEVPTYDHGYMHFSTSEKYDINDTLHSAVTTGGTEGTTHEVPTYDHGYIHFSTSEKYDINDSAITTDDTETTAEQETHSTAASVFFSSTDVDSIEEKDRVSVVTHPTTSKDASESSTEHTHIKSVTTAVPSTTKFDESIEDSEADSESVEDDLDASSVEIHSVNSTNELDSDSLHTHKNETEIIEKNETDEDAAAEIKIQTTHFSHVTDSTTLQKEIHETTSSEFSTLTPEVQKEASESSTHAAHVTTSHSDYEASLSSNKTFDSLDTTEDTTPHHFEVEHPETSTEVDELVEISTVQSSTRVEVSPLDTSTKFEETSDTPISSLGILTAVDESKEGITIASHDIETTHHEIDELGSASDFSDDNESLPSSLSTVSDKLDLHTEYNSGETSSISPTENRITTLIVSDNPTDVTETKIQYTTGISESIKTTISHDTESTTVDSNELKSDATFETKQTIDDAETKLKVTHGSSHVDVEIEDNLLSSEVPEIEEDSPSTSYILNGSLSIENQESEAEKQDTTIETSSLKSSTSENIFLKEKEENIKPTVVYVPEKTTQEDTTGDLTDSEDTASKLEVLTTELSSDAPDTNKNRGPTTLQSVPQEKVTSTSASQTTIPISDSPVKSEIEHSTVTLDSNVDSSTLSEITSPTTTEESGSNVTDETVIAKHATQIFSTTTTESSVLETTTLKLEEKITTTESNLPSAFEPPLANILKQQMLFHKQQVTETTSTLTTIPVEESQNSQTNATENDPLRLSLTLDETANNADNSSLIHEETENVFVLNHEYTIPDSEISIIEVADSDDKHDEPTETLTLVEDKTLNPDHIYNENGDSFIDEMDSEAALNETADNGGDAAHEISNLLPDAFDDHSLPAERPEALSVNNIDDNVISNFSEESSTQDVQTPSHIQEYEKAYSNGVIDVKDISRQTTTVTSISFSEDNVKLETSTEVEKYNIGNEASTVDLDVVSKMSTSHETDEKDNKHTEAEYDIDHLQENNNETDLEYLDAENSESSDDDKESSATVSVSSLHPESTSQGISDSTSSLNYGFTENKESELATDKRATVSATVDSKSASTSTQSDGEQVTVSTEADIEIPQEGTTIQINILFGQDSFDPSQIHKNHSSETNNESNLQGGSSSIHKEIPVNSEVKIMISEDIKSNDAESTKHKLDFGDQDIKEHSLGENFEFSTPSEEISENLNSKVDSDLHSSQHNLNATKDPAELVSITSDSTSSYTEQNSVTNSFDESNSDDSVTNVEESSSPFTVLEYLGELFSGVGTFSTSNNIDSKTTQSNSEFSTETGNTEFNDPTTNDSSASSEQKYNSDLKDQFANYGQLGGVFITGESKYKPSSFNQDTQNAENNSIVYNLGNKSEDYNSKVNDSTYFNGHKQDSEELMESEETSEVTETSVNSAEKGDVKDESEKEFISEEEILHSKVSDLENDDKHKYSDTVVTDVSERENTPSTVSTVVTSSDSKEPNDSLLANTEIKEVGPEKGGDWFESTDPDLSLANFDTQENITTLSVNEVENELSTSTGATDELENDSDSGLQAVLSANNNSSKNESNNLDSDDNDSLFPKTDIEYKGPEKGGEWFETTEPDLTLANDNNENNETTLPNEKENNSISITGTDSNDGPEKGGEVFEPTIPNLFPINGANTEIKNNNISDVNVTENAVESTQKSVLSKNDFESSEIESETNIDAVHSEFIPPLPILLRGINKHVQRNNTSGPDQVLNDAGNDRTIALDANSDEITSPSSKAAFSRSFNHRFHMSDVISKVFKAPGYDTEVQLSPLQGFASLKKSKGLRLKRDVTPEENSSPPQTVNIDSHSKNPDERANPINTKNVLLVEGYGQKPSGFFPVTSSFIIVHSDEDDQENETGVDPKRKPAGNRQEVSIPGENLPEKITFANQEGKVEPSTTKTHSTKR